MLVEREAHLGGKSIRSTGGNTANFLLRNQMTGNALIVELKTRATKLTAENRHRNNAHPPSKELARAVQQVLQQHCTLRQSYASLAGDGDPPFRVFKPTMLLLIGNLSRESHMDRVLSFELFRGSIPEVAVVTFDELVGKARLPLELFEGSR